MNDFLQAVNRFLARLGSVKTAELIILLKQLAALVESGVPIVPSLTILAEQAKNRRLKYTLQEIKIGVESGQSLSEAMDKHPKVFPLTVRNTVRIGEVSGMLDTSINQVTEFLEEQSTLKSAVITALIYPAIVLTATLGVVGFMVLGVIPKIIPFIEMMGGEMPWNTKLLVSVTNYTQNNIKSMAMGVASFAGAIFLLYRTRRGRYYLDYAKMLLPLFGVVIQYNIIVQFSKTMFLLMSSGVTMVESLRTVRETNKNAVVRRAIDRFIGKVLLGESLSESMTKAKELFPPMVGSMVKVGEETGTMDMAMRRIADIHYSILQNYIKRLNAALEPVMLLVLGGLVGFVAAGMIGGILAGYVAK